MTDKTIVTDDDRMAAAVVVACGNAPDNYRDGYAYAVAIKCGECDDSVPVQTLARHRLSQSPDTMPNSVVEALNKRAFDIAMQEATPADARDVIEDLTKALATLSQQPAQTDVHQGERDKALEELVNDTIDDWHEDPHTDLTLPERLGWSDEEYSRWVETGELPPMLAALKGATQ